MPSIRNIAPCLWFDDQAEEAAKFYVGIFSLSQRSRIVKISHFGKEGYEIHERPAGSVMTAVFELDGQRFTALNGGPGLTFNAAISFEVECETQDEIDHFWEKLSEGGDPASHKCGWLKDRYGVSWQIVPAMLAGMVAEPTPAAERATAAMLRMKKLDIAALKRAYEG